MRVIARLVLLVSLLGLTAGPLAALPLGSPAGASLAPAAASASPLDRAATWLTLAGFVLGAIRIKDTGALAKKFVQRASQAAGDYKTGVEASGADWEANTKASEQNYADGVTAAIGRKAFGMGVAKAGAAKFTQRASTLGAQRYPSGVQAAEGAWSQGFQPFSQVLAGLSLPPRRPKGDPGNQQRANAVAVALRAAKVGH